MDLRFCSWGRIAMRCCVPSWHLLCLVLALLAAVLVSCSTSVRPPSTEPDKVAKSASEQPSATKSNDGIAKSNQAAPVEDAATAPRDVKPTQNADAARVEVRPLTAEQMQRLLSIRLNGGMGASFSQFANQFLVASRIQMGVGIGLMTPDPEIAEMLLRSPFPSTYEPTLHEFLDALALQTFSQWKYDPTNQYVRKQSEHGGEFHEETPEESKSSGEIDDLAIFEFTKTKAQREKPFAVTVAEGWQAIDKGSWVMYVPPRFPVGMDIYEMGTYSPQGQDAMQDFYSGIRAAVALEWAQLVHEGAKPEDLRSAKVGAFDSLFYETTVPSSLGEDLHWRHWVFMVDNACYFVVSTLPPDREDKLLPDVERMLASFQMTPPEQTAKEALKEVE